MPKFWSIRYEAEWVDKQHFNEQGEWDADKDEYSVSHHDTREAAAAAAIAESKKTNYEWISVAKQQYMPARIGGEWIDIQRWTGDWDGLHDETYKAYPEFLR
jgi:hypothetical protein